MIKKVSFLILLISFSIFGASSVLANSELEPNDTVKEGTKISVNQEYRGVLSSSNDMDYFEFTLTKPGNVSISLPNFTEQSWNIYLYDSNGKEVNRFNTTYGNFATGATKDQIGLPAGTYYIRVNSYTNAAKVPYSFNLQYKESKVYEQELNDTVQEATKITVNHEYQGVLSSSNDMDYFEFILTKPGNVSISLPNFMEQSWNIYLYDSNGKEVNRFNTTYGNFATGATKDQIGLPAGTYYIRVNSYTNAAKVPYSFNLQYDETSFFEKELNDSAQDANAIQLNYKYQGVLSSSNDVDYFSIKVDKNSNLLLSLPNTTDSSWYARIYDNTGKEITQFNTQYGSYVSDITTEQLGLTAGVYYIKISSYTNADKVPYSFVLSSRKFHDVPVGFWGYNEITYLYNNGIIKGYENNTFRPNNNITRAQAAIMISRALNLNLKNVANPSYKDVATNHSAYREIAAVTNEGIFPKSASFNPNGLLTRGDMASALVNAYNLTGNYSGKIVDVTNSQTLKDVGALAANNITNIYSDHTFRPNNPVNRAQFSAFFTRILNEEYRR